MIKKSRWFPSAGVKAIFREPWFAKIYIPKVAWERAKIFGSGYTGLGFFSESLAHILQSAVFISTLKRDRYFPGQDSRSCVATGFSERFLTQTETIRDRYRVSSPFLKAQTGERKMTEILQGKGYTGNTVLYMVEAVLLHGHGVRQHQMEIRWESGFSNEELSIIGSDEIQHELLP